MSDQRDLYEYSWILYRVLDRLYGSREIVAMMRRLTVLEEQSQCSEKDFSFFQTGSFAEGVNMTASDMDVMFIQKHVIVISPDQDTSSLQDISDKSVFIMRDAHSRPGYVTLELAKMGQMGNAMAKSIVRVGDFSFISSEMYKRSWTDLMRAKSHMIIDTHGPANVVGKQNNIDADFDIVQAFPCSGWPCEANEWVGRHRLFNWPDKCLRDQIVQGGCHLVPVGDKMSADPFLQWRISFATAERKLVHSLTYVQFLVYCLLKHFLKQISGILEHVYGDADIISSYIVKTVIFHAIENTPLILWQEKNMFLCFILCLNILTTWVNAGYCPNYFIYRNNMFLGKVYGEIQQKLLSFLVELHEKAWGCLSIGTYIQPSVGKIVDSVTNGEWQLVLPTPAQSEREHDLKIFIRMSSICTLALPKKLAFARKSTSGMDEFITYLIMVNYLSSKGMETFEKNNSVRGNKEKYKSLLKCRKFMTPQASACKSPGLLTLATYHYQTGNYMKALQMCGHVISSFKVFVQGTIDEKIQERYEHLCCGRGFTLSHKCQLAYVSRIAFKGAFRHFCPSQLHPEVRKRGFAGTLLIPPLPYAVFLKFLCYHELGDNRRRVDALTYLRAVKYDGQQGGYKHWIVHNFLGICYEMVGDIHRALREYRDSLSAKSPFQHFNPASERIQRLENLHRQDKY